MPCCDTTKNIGWRLVLGIPGLLTIIVGLFRKLVFPTFESPKFLVAKRRHTDAIEVLERMAVRNHKPTWLTASLLHEASEDGVAPAAPNVVSSTSFWRCMGLADVLEWMRNDPRLMRSTFALLLAFPAVGLAYP